MHLFHPTGVTLLSHILKRHPYSEVEHVGRSRGAGARVDKNNAEIIRQRFHALVYSLLSSVAASVVQIENEWMVSGDPAVFVPDHLSTIRQSILQIYYSLFGQCLPTSIDSFLLLLFLPLFFLR
jgi:hypothetical protein